MTVEYNSTALRKCFVRDVQNYEHYYDIPESWSNVMLAYPSIKSLYDGKEDVAGHIGIFQINANCPFCENITKQLTIYTWIGEVIEEYLRRIYNLLVCEDCRNYSVVGCEEYDDDRDYFMQFSGYMWFSSNLINQSAIKKIGRSLANGQEISQAISSEGS